MAEQESQPDNRPRPQYGELAPPGWVWRPPADADRLDTSRPLEREDDVPPVPAAPILGQRPPAGGAPVTGADGKPSPTWDLTLTVLLGVFGLFGMANSIAALQAIPASMQLLHTTNSLGEYVPVPLVGTLVLVGSILMAVIWAVTAGIAAWLLVKRRLAFWVPLVGGIVALLVLLIFMVAVLATDPVLLGFYGGVTPSPVETP